MGGSNESVSLFAKYSNKMRQRGQVVRAQDLKFGGPGFCLLMKY